jgi:hypothetical protein
VMVNWERQSAKKRRKHMKKIVWSLVVGVVVDHRPGLDPSGSVSTAQRQDLAIASLSKWPWNSGANGIRRLSFIGNAGAGW